MSEETPKITTTKKEKDPKRVEAGKWLAAICKAAKERKMREKIESENKQENGSSDYSTNDGLVFGILGTVAAIGSLCYTREEYKRDTVKQETTREEPEIKHVIKTDYRPPENNLDSFEWKKKSPSQKSTIPKRDNGQNPAVSITEENISNCNKILYKDISYNSV